MGVNNNLVFLEKIPKKEIGPSDSLLAGAVRMAEQTNRRDHRRGKP